MAGGKGSKAPSYNPAMSQQMMGYLQPKTSLPPGMAVTSPTVYSPQQIMQQASAVDSMLPSFMQMNSSNRSLRAMQPRRLRTNTITRQLLRSCNRPRCTNSWAETWAIRARRSGLPCSALSRPKVRTRRSSLVSNTTMTS